jgi:hypothetical protein
MLTSQTCDTRIEQALRQCVALGMFGSVSRKPVWLYGNTPWVPSLQKKAKKTKRSVPFKQLARQYTDHAGKVRCVGKPSMRASQSGAPVPIKGCCD